MYSMLDTGKFYHIYNHANGFENIFREEKNYSFFLEKLKIHVHPIAEIMGFCLLPNHFHFLLKIRSASEIVGLLTYEENQKLIKYEQIQRFISKQFSNFFSSYTQSFNKIYKRRGSLFIKNFKFKLIENNSQLITTLLYVHLNAVKHGFVKTHTEWKWTSYAFYFDSQEQSWLSTKIIETLIVSKENYHKLHIKRKMEILKYLEE
jgi:REP element-mobilizing transposase RayT